MQFHAWNSDSMFPHVRCTSQHNEILEPVVVGIAVDVVDHLIAPQSAP